MLLKKYQTGGKVGKAGSYKKTDLWRKEKEQNIKDKETAILNTPKGDLEKKPSKEYMKKISKQLQARQYEASLREGFLEGRPPRGSIKQPARKGMTRYKGKESLSRPKNLLKMRKALLLKEYTKKLKKEGKGEPLSGTFRNVQPRKKKMLLLFIKKVEKY